MNKNRITLKQIAANLRWKNAIKLRGLDEKGFEKILDLMDKIFNRNNIPPGTAAELLFSSIRYMLKNQLDPLTLEEEIRTKKNQLESIQDNIRITSGKLENSKLKLEAQLESLD